MGRWRYAAFLLLPLAVPGCLWCTGESSTSWLDRFRGFSGPEGPDVVYLDVALIEQPLADEYINREAWHAIDEQVLPIEKSGLLAENGLRVGLITGIVPPPLHELMTHTASCPDPRRIQLRAGNPTIIPLNGPVPESQLTWYPDRANPEEMTIQNGEWAFHITPELGGDNRVKLICHPNLTHGEPKFWRPSSEGGQGLSLGGRPAVMNFDELAWEVSLAPNDYVVIGTQCDQPESVGYQSLVTSRGRNLIQRLMVIRVGRSTPAPLEEEFSTREPTPLLSGVPPLASQATRGIARGASPQR